MSELSFHRIADIFPLMEGSEFSLLVADIREHGLLEPIILHESKILDGRNRYRACEEAGIDPRFETYAGKDPLSYVISLNLKRRHLNESQRAMVAAKLSTLRHGGSRSSDQGANLRLARAHAATLLNVSERTIDSAAAVRDHGVSELRRAVERGAITVNRAAALTQQPPEFQKAVVAKVESGSTSTEALRQTKKEFLPNKIAALPSGVYRVIYCDPPWQYNDARQTGDHRESTGALHHYSTMTIDELQELDVKNIAAPDAVMLMWATFPLLQEALDLVKSWGFTYKTAFVWDKGHGAFGNYHDAEAELLLVGTRGSCVPECDSKEKQIQRFLRSKHSSKPEGWRTLIDKLWPSGPRVELFRRGAVPAGWETWGAEAIEEAAE